MAKTAQEKLDAKREKSTTRNIKECTGDLSETLSLMYSTIYSLQCLH